MSVIARGAARGDHAGGARVEGAEPNGGTTDAVVIEHCARLSAKRAKFRGLGNGREVLIHMQERNVCAHRNRGNQTVDQFTNCFALTATTTVNRGCRVEVDRLGRKQGGSRKQPPQLLQVLLIACTGQDFHSNGVARRDSRSKKCIDTLANR
jgi:hypothetical protein